MPYMRDIACSPLLSHFPCHQHDAWEIVLYVRGTGRVLLDGVPYRFAPGTLIAIPPGVAHEDHAQEQDPFMNYHLRVVGWREPGSVVPMGRDDSHRTLESLCRLLAREAQSDADSTACIGEHLFAALLAAIERSTSTTEHEGVVEQIQRRLRGALADPDVDLEVALMHLGCSRDHARRLFHASTGTTPRAWLTRLRLDAACRLLRQGRSISDAARRVGIHDPGYFSRLFTRHYGAPPRAWRRTGGAGGKVPAPDASRHGMDPRPTRVDDRSRPDADRWRPHAGDDEDAG